MLALRPTVPCLAALGLAASLAWGTQTGIIVSNSNGVGDALGDLPRNSTPTPYDSFGLVPGDTINIAVLAYTDAAAGADLGVGGFELTFGYDPNILSPRQFEKTTPPFQGLKSLYSDVLNHAYGSLETYCWTADVTADTSGQAFSLLPELVLDDAAHTVMLAGSPDAGLKNLGADSQAILAGQIAFDVVAAIPPGGTKLDVTATAVPIGGVQPGDEIVVLGNTFAGSTGTGEILIAPEPGSLALLAAGLVCVIRRGRRR